MISWRGLISTLPFCVALFGNCYSNVAFIPEVGARYGDGLSYARGYESVDAILGVWSSHLQSSFFVDLEFHRVDEGRLATNTGICWRSYCAASPEVVGASIFFDTRRIAGSTLEQIGVGVELLGRCWDVRGNGYIPIGKKSVGLFDELDYISPPYFAVKEDIISAMWGLDVEVGRTLCCGKCGILYGGIGPYFYNSLCCNSFIGGLGRIRFETPKGVSVEAFASYDQFFGARFQGEVFFALPLLCSRQIWKCLFRPIRRNRIIVVEDLSCYSTNF